MNGFLTDGVDGVSETINGWKNKKHFGCVEVRGGYRLYTVKDDPVYILANMIPEQAKLEMVARIRNVTVENLVNKLEEQQAKSSSAKALYWAGIIQTIVRAAKDAKACTPSTPVGLNNLLS